MFDFIHPSIKPIITTSEGMAMMGLQSLLCVIHEASNDQNNWLARRNHEQTPDRLSEQRT
jgi:hypothetical protein